MPKIIISIIVMLILSCGRPPELRCVKIDMVEYIDHCGEDLASDLITGCHLDKPVMRKKCVDELKEKEEGKR